MTTTNTNNTTDPYAYINGNKTQPQPTNSNTELGQNAFLKLMIAQLKNQDPMKPQDPSEFMSQLAQFSQVTSTQNMESSIQTLTDSMRSTQVLNGTNLVGHDVLAPSDTDTITSGSTVNGALDLPKGTTAVKILVKDASGAQVRTFDLATPTEGLNNFTWDGKTNTGTDAPTGTYTFEATATAGGQTGSVDPLLTSRVSSVTIDPSSGTLTLNTSAGALALNDVRRVL
ncbi:MAG: flagellar hook assembly protein FlgD [Gammaproteobacteria bacterium]